MRTSKWLLAVSLLAAILGLTLAPPASALHPSSPMPSSLRLPDAAPGGGPVDVPSDASLLPGVLRDAIVAAGAPSATALQPIGFDREVVTGDIVHYRFLVRTRPGPYGAFQLHRVVREPRAGRPLQTARNVFLQHGDAKDFVGMFLPGTRSTAWPRDFGFAVYLARNGVDVWGIDQAWCLVPAEETDFAFMADFGMDRAMGDLRTGVAVARALRLATGSGLTKMILLGYSSGVATTGALLSAEATLPSVLRQISAYIPVDVPLQTDDAAVRSAFLGDLALQEAALAAGQYGSFVPFQIIGQLAHLAPDEDSPLFPGYTNYQFACLLLLAPGAGFPAGAFHYLAGVLDDTGFPTGPRLTTVDQWFAFLEGAITWQPARFFQDLDKLILADPASPYDDHFADVRVPVLAVTPRGGFGDLMRYGIDQLGSTDVEFLVPSTGGPAETDIGHIDIFSWQGSESLWWPTALRWMVAHTPGSGRLALDDGSDEGDAPGVAAAVPGRFGLDRVSPNPARGGDLVVRFSLTGEAAARLDLIDVSGRRVAEREVGAMGAGAHTVTLARSERLAPGVYLVRLTRAGDVSTLRAAVVR